MVSCVDFYTYEHKAEAQFQALLLRFSPPLRFSGKCKAVISFVCFSTHGGRVSLTDCEESRLWTAVMLLFSRFQELMGRLRGWGSRAGLSGSASSCLSSPSASPFWLDSAFAQVSSRIKESHILTCSCVCY